MTIKEKEKAGLSKFTPATVVKPIEKLDDNGKVLDRYASVSVAAKENNVSVSALSIAIRRGTKCKKMTFRFAKKPEPEEKRLKQIEIHSSKELISEDAKKRFAQKPYGGIYEKRY